MSYIKWVENVMPRSKDEYLALMSLDSVREARAFHRSFPQYSVTPLVRLSGMARELNVADIFVKDESYRFGLNAFKVLGGSFAMAKYIAGRVGRPISQVDYAYLTGDAIKREFGQATFFTATDGNHGRGVAWAANKLGQRAVVHMPKGSAKSRFDNIAREGAIVTIEDMNYDDCVRLAAKEASETENGVIVQDTAWEGYEDIPGYIMQGYGTMALEALTQLREYGAERPTHIFVQAGVGSLAGAVQGFFSGVFAENEPKVIVMEAAAADCLYRGAAKGDGSPAIVAGDLATIMAGLACGEPNTISWDILRNHTAMFLSCRDELSALGMRMLGAPVAGDARVISGESGAIGMGVLACVMKDARLAELKRAMGLDENSRVMMFSTEGDTDPEGYKRAVWNGAHQYDMEGAQWTLSQ